MTECMQHEDHCGNCGSELDGGWTDEDRELAAEGVAILCEECWTTVDGGAA